jgi:hypothetical protein
MSALIIQNKVHLICNKKPIVLFGNAAMRLRSKRPLHVQGAGSHPG